MIHLCAFEDIPAWQYTPRCISCGRWCRDYKDEWNGDYRCERCARKETR